MESGRSTRRYASSIAIVSGVYAIWSAASATLGSPMMSRADAGVGMGTTLMLALGIVVLVHGVLLVTPAAERLGLWSAPLMLLWGLLMLLDQALLAVMPGWGMAGMGLDGGMVAIATLMLASGLIMGDAAR